MRWLLRTLLALFAAVLPAQDRQARVELEDGRVVAGRVKHMGLDGIDIETAEGVQHVPAAAIRRAQLPKPQADEARPTAPEEQETVVKQAPAPTGPVARVRERMRALDERWPWLAPQAPLQWLSLCVTGFALLSLCVHLAAKTALCEDLVFARSVGMAAWFLVSGVLLLAFLPANRTLLMTAGALHLLVDIVLFRRLYALPVLLAALATGVLGVCIGAGYCILLAVDALLRSIGVAS